LSESALQICWVSNKKPKVLAPSKICNMPYMFLAAVQPLQPLWEFLPPQHMGIG
jgi:hypothetical protein